MSFPTLLYRTPGTFRRPNGVTFDTIGAADADAYAELLAKGWHPTLEAAIEAKKPKPAPVIAPPPPPPVAEPEPIDEYSPPVREELVEQARRLNLRVTKRTTDEMLMARITEAMSKDNGLQ